MTTEDVMFGLPAPSDIELEAADRFNYRILTFGEFCTWYGILETRDLFHAFVRRDTEGSLPRGVWRKKWHDFLNWGWAATIAAQDARDQRETQNVACDRFDDGDGIRFDPHLDACIG